MRRSTAFFLVVGLILLLDDRTTWAQKYELKLSDGRVERFDFEQKGIEGWKTVDGRWSVEEAKDAPSGKKVLVQRAVENQFNVIVAPGGPYTDADVSRSRAGKTPQAGSCFGFLKGSITS